MNVCGENPIMALLHQAYRKHRGGQAQAFKGHISQVVEGYRANQILPQSVCVWRDRDALTRKKPALTFVQIPVSIFL